MPPHSNAHVMQPCLSVHDDVESRQKTTQTVPDDFIMWECPLSNADSMKMKVVMVAGLEAMDWM